MNNKPEEQHIWEAYRSYDGFASDKDSPTTLDRDHGGKGTQIGKGHSSVRGEGKTKNTMKYDHRSKKFFKPVDRSKEPEAHDKKKEKKVTETVGTSNIDTTGSEGKDWSAYKAAHKKAGESGAKPGTKEYAAAHKKAGRKSVNEDMDDMSHGQFMGDPSVEPMARMEPQEAGGGEGDGPRPSTVSMDVIEKGNVVKTAAGAVRVVVDKSNDSPYGIIKLIANEPEGELSKGDRMTVHFDDLEPVADSIEEYKDDVPWDESATRLARQSMDEDCGCGGPEPIHG